ncbi:MAG: hypothetical protein HDR72_05450 [Ruminococcaceae bacterium]|nr:hypothetical protein [Oscillospiraceae bacterium]
MPMREITLDDGTVCRRMITNVHPDGTEFLPENFTITGRNEQERRILNLARGIIESGVERERKAKEKTAN